MTSALDASAGEGIWSAARPTSMAAPAMRRASSARASAASSTRLPRDTLMKNAVGFMRAKAASFIRFSVASVATARQTTKSASANKVSNGTWRMPGSLTCLCGSLTMTVMPSATPSGARYRPITP